MAQADVKYDYTPLNQFGTRGRGASVAAMRTALNGYNSTSYSTAKLDAMTKLDMTYAIKVHSLGTSGT